MQISPSPLQLSGFIVTEEGHCEKWFQKEYCFSFAEEKNHPGQHAIKARGSAKIFHLLHGHHAIFP